jgi:hypothetical protein
LVGWLSVLVLPPPTIACLLLYYKKRRQLPIYCAFKATHDSTFWSKTSPVLLSGAGSTFFSSGQTTISFSAVWRLVNENRAIICFARIRVHLVDVALQPGRVLPVDGVFAFALRQNIWFFETGSAFCENNFC